MDKREGYRMRLAIAFAALAVAFLLGSKPTLARDCFIEIDGKSRSGSGCQVAPNSDRKIEFGFVARLQDLAISVSWVEPPYYIAEVPGDADARPIGRVQRIGDCWVGQRARICIWRSSTPADQRLPPDAPDWPEEFELPQINVDIWCDHFHSVMKNLDTRAKRICVSKEQSAYDVLKAWWPSVDEDVKQRCLTWLSHRLGDIAYGSIQTLAYDNLASCIDNQMSQRFEKQEPKFRP